MLSLLMQLFHVDTGEKKLESLSMDIRTDSIFFFSEICLRVIEI